MLIGQITDTNRNPALQQLVSQLARTHRSRYPVRVVSGDRDTVNFYDSRLLDQKVGALSKQNGNDLLIESPLIENNKYSRDRSMYHTRKTTDLAKMRKWLMEYILCIPAEMIPGCTESEAEVVFARWRDEHRDAYHQVYRKIDGRDVLDSIIAYKKGGAPYATQKLAEVLNSNFMEMMEEHTRRNKFKYPTRNIFINPDGPTQVAVKEKTYEKTYDPYVITQHLSFEALDEDTRGKCAILKLAENKSYVEGVGVKICANNFWVY